MRLCYTCPRHSESTHGSFFNILRLILFYVTLESVKHVRLQISQFGESEMSFLSDLQRYAQSNVSAHCLPVTFEMNLENLPHTPNEFLWKVPLLQRFMQILVLTAIS